MSQDLEKENVERIHCNLIRVKEPIDGLNVGQYLEIKFGKTFFVLEKIFLLEIKKVKDKICPTEQKQQKVSVSSAITINQDQSSGSVYKDVLDFIIKDTFGNNYDFNNLDKLYITSKYHLFLELPWEDLIKKPNGIVIREIPSKENKNLLTRENNLLIVTSYAHKHIGSTLEIGITKEIKDILSECIECNEIKHRMNNMTWNRHVTEEQINKIDFKQFSFIHFAMHGYENGGIYLSLDSADKSKLVKVFETCKLLKKMEDCKFSLIFFSTCYSGGGLDDIDKQGLSFQFIRNGLSMYSIGYIGKSGNDSLPVFAKLFYKYLMSFQDIEVVYEKSMKEYKNGLNNKKYIPCLYKAV